MKQNKGMQYLLIEDYDGWISKHTKDQNNCLKAYEKYRSCANKNYGTAVTATMTASDTNTMDIERGQIEAAIEDLFNLRAARSKYRAAGRGLHDSQNRFQASPNISFVPTNHIEQWYQWSLFTMTLARHVSKQWRRSAKTQNWTPAAEINAGRCPNHTNWKLSYSTTMRS